MRIGLFLLFTVPIFAGVLELGVKYDPFERPKGLKSPAFSSGIRTEEPVLDLVAVFNDKANINGRFYKIGDYISGYKIVAIKRKYVILKKGSKSIILPIVKKRVLAWETR